jgi:hypothetical protein
MPQPLSTDLARQVPNLGDAAFARIAGEAEKNCPMSKVLNAAITLDAKLTPLTANSRSPRKDEANDPQSST